MSFNFHQPLEYCQNIDHSQFVLQVATLLQRQFWHSQKEIVKKSGEVWRILVERIVGLWSTVILGDVSDATHVDHSTIF